MADLPQREPRGPFSPWPELEGQRADGALVFETDEYALVRTREELAEWVTRTAARGLGPELSLDLARRLINGALEASRSGSVEADPTQNIAVMMFELETLFADTAGEGAVYCDPPRGAVANFAKAIEADDDNAAAGILDVLSGAMLGTLRAAFATEAERRGEEAPSHRTVRRRFIRGSLLLSRLHALLAINLAATPDLE